MALNIKDEETDRLARELASETGQTITEAVRDAIVARLDVARRRRVRGGELDAVIARGRARRTLDERPEAEILGYDADGIPA